MKEIITSIISGDKESFRHIIKEYAPAIRAFLASHLNNPESVDDLSQEVFIAAYESLTKFDLEKDFGMWVKGIARNKLMMHLRRFYQHSSVMKKLKAEVLTISYEFTQTHHEKNTLHLIEKLKQCIEKLPERIKSVIHARYFAQKKVMQIAKQLGTSAQAVSALLFRGRKQLEICVERMK